MLFLSAVSRITGNGWMLFYTMLAAGLSFPILVGIRNVVDAMCLFLLIPVGMVLVVEVASGGPRSILP